MLRNSLNIASILKQKLVFGHSQIHLSAKACQQAKSNATTPSSQFIETIIKPFTVTTYARPTVVATHGKGSVFYDLENKKYIDFTAGIAVNGLGHANEEITMIIAEQASTLVHCSNLIYNLSAGELANKLVLATHASGGMHDAERVFLCNSGTEANEAALKFARKYGKSFHNDKIEIISFENGFHGRSMGALSVTANPKYQTPFAPLIPGIKTAQPNDIESVKSHIDKEKTCAIIIEPIQGEGGVTSMNEDFLIQLRKICDDANVLLIYDEIQCGLGRSGKLWAHSHLPAEAHPDIITSAKALGNGFPIGATIINEKIEQALAVGDHGTTFGGNPLGSKIGCYVVDTISDEAFLANVNNKSDRFVKGLNKIKEEFPNVIEEVRGKGLLLGLQFKPNINVADVQSKCLENGLFVVAAGMNVLRVIPPLNIPNNLIEEGLQILAKSIGEVV